MPDTKPESPEQHLQSLLERCKTLQLATTGAAGAEASYCPFIFRDGAFYVFTSELASHTVNMLSNPALGIMLITDESASRNLFARSRLTLQCQAEKLARDNQQWPELMEQMQQRHGDTVALLRTLADFHLFRLMPESGRLIIGFGKAYQVTLPGFILEQVEGP